MFTFSFNTAFAAVDTNADANLLNQAADYLKSQLPEAVKKAYQTGIASGKLNAFITEEAWETASADIVEALETEINTTKDEYFSGTKDPANVDKNWNKYDYVYAATKLFSGYDYIALAERFAKNDDLAVVAANEQFKLALADAIAIYDKIDVATLYSTTTPKDGKSYYQQAVEAVANNKAAFNEFYLTADNSVQNAGNTVSQIRKAAAALEGQVYSGATLGTVKLTAVAKKYYEDAKDVVEYYYFPSIPTKAKEDIDNATEEAKAAAAKAAAQAAYATYIVDTTNENYNKTFAANWLKVVTYLAGENEIDNYTTDMLLAGMRSADDSKEEVKKYADAIDEVKALESYAAKCAAEKDSKGNFVRNAEDIKKIVDKFTLESYKYAAGLAQTKPDLGTAKGNLEVLSINTDDAKLAFDKAAKKADLDDYMNGYEIKTGYVCVDDYYDLEAAAVEAAYETAKVKVDALTDMDDYADIELALIKELDKIKTSDDVDNLFETSKMSKELVKQVDALVAYITYKNSATKPYEDAYVLGADNNEDGKANAKVLLTDYYIDNNARTLAEMQALTGAVEEVAAGLPTNAELTAALKAAQDAIKALPTAAKTTSADKDAYQNAFDLAKAYNKMVKTATGTAGTEKIAESKINALHAALQYDVQVEYAKVDKNDKAALKAIAAKVKELNGNVGSTKLFAKKFTDPTVSALAKIRTNEFNAVRDAINAIPFTVTEADKAVVKKARELYNAFVAEYTDYDLNRVEPQSDKDGYVADDFDVTALVRAEAALGLNAEDPALAVKSMKLRAYSKYAKKGITVKWVIEDGRKSDAKGYQVWRSTKANSGYKKLITVNPSYGVVNAKNLKKGVTYYYKVRAYNRTADGKLVFSDWSNKAYRKAR